MKAIVTKYHGPTDTKGSRITASDEDGNRVTISYPYELSGEAVHRKAAQALCNKMGWTGELTAGGLKNAYVFVFTHHWSDCVQAANELADLVCVMYHPKDSKARVTFPTATWAEIIARHIGATVPTMEVQS